MKGGPSSNELEGCPFRRCEQSHILLAKKKRQWRHSFRGCPCRSKKGVKVLLNIKRKDKSIKLGKLADCESDWRSTTCRLTSRLVGRASVGGKSNRKKQKGTKEGRGGGKHAFGGTAWRVKERPAKTFLTRLTRFLEKGWLKAGKGENRMGQKFKKRC